MNEWTGAKTDPREASRLDALTRLGLVEPPGDPALDDVTRLAALLCETPSAAIAVVGADRVDLISPVGVPIRVVPREGLDCRETLLHPDARTVESVRGSNLRAACPLLRKLPDREFYSAAPLKTADGEVLGALVVLDSAPRILSKGQTAGLKTLAGMTIRLLEARQRPPDREGLLRHQETLAATGRMAARVAHEVNNPLAGIKNAFLLLKDAIPADHKYAHYVPRVQKEIERIAAIMRQMIELYQPREEPDQPFPVEYTLREILSFIEPAARERNVHLQLELEIPRAGQARLPEGSFRQIVYNIVQNAIDASPVGGMVTVHVQVDNEVLKCRVTDRGGGIPPEIQRHVFEPFYSTKIDRPGMGLGLGLSVSKGLAEGLGGSLEFDSGAGAGTVFTVTLPLKRPA